MINRREFIIDIAKGATTTFLGATLLNLKALASDERKPNILIIVSDDTGWDDVGYHNPKILTPNLNRLAIEGAELNNFYVHPVCSPTRAALLTGRHPSRFGILGPISDEEKIALPKHIVTLPELLRRNGYKTGIIGKWHLGLELHNGPKQFGFDITYGYLHGQIDPHTHLYKWGNKTWHKDDKHFDEEGHVTDLITEEALSFLEAQKKSSQPFFLYVAHSAPHFPLNEDDKWLDLYLNIENRSRRQFAAAMTHMDDSIGKILDCLKQNGLEENTLLVYLSDNGGQEKWVPKPKEYGGKFPVANMLGSNEPYRGWKGELYEGGIRVPAIFYWKDKLCAQKVNELIAVEDIYPTIANLVGAVISDDCILEGTNIWEALEGKSVDKRVLYWRTDKQCAIREGNWKLIFIGKEIDNGKYELYDIVNDPYEKNNLVDTEKKIFEELKKELIYKVSLDPKDI